MELLFNDLSLHGQFRSARDFEESIGRVMEMREIAGRFGRKLHCHRNLVNAQVTPELRMPQVVGGLAADKGRALMGWLTKHGPFLEDIREHGDDDYLTCRDEIVTEKAVGEAAYCRFHDIDRGLVSLAPSLWETSPLHVTWHNGGSKSVDVENYWERETLQRDLASVSPPMGTWRDLERIVRTRYAALTFSDDAFEPIRRHPFVSSAAERIIQILGVLHDLKHSFDAQGRLTNEGHELYDKHFKGDKALITNSSPGDIAQFGKELTFRNPSNPNEYLFCPWHGKVKSTVPIRVHYHWPIRADAPVYVVYVGTKIATK